MIKYLLPTLIVLASCQTPKQKDSAEETTAESPSLIGEWRNVSLKVEMDKKHGAPSSVFEVDEATWEEKLQIRPIQTFFTEDSRFNSEHYNLEDSLVLNPEGTWTATDSEITMITTSPFNDTTSCTYSISDDIITFGCWVDWDEDGEKDDWYEGTQRRH